jgi:flagellar hook-associated protein 3 FlgL
VRQISEALRDTANTSYLDRPVFGGTTKEAMAYPDAMTFNGNGEAVMRTVGGNTEGRCERGRPAWSSGRGQVRFSGFCPTSPPNWRAMEPG